MKASNSRNATPAEYLEHLRQRNGIEHARRIRDKLGWRWRLSAMLWTVRHHWLSWVAGAFTVLTGAVSFAANLTSLFG